MAQLSYLGIFFHFAIEIYRLISGGKFNRKRFLQVTINVWILLNLLIQPTHNTIVISLWVLLRSCLAHVGFISPLDSIDFFYVIAKSGYFSLGNSNNLNTIQVHSGMVGINELNEPIVAVLLFSSTFSSIVFWLLHIAENLEYLFGFNVLDFNFFKF